MLEWLHTFGIDVKGIITAIVGAAFKWLLDRNEKAQLRADINSQKAETRSLGESLETTHRQARNGECREATGVGPAL
jgi:hypothetical protein